MKLLVESDFHQIRVAVLENGRPSEIYLEHHGDRGVVGNVYQGRVSRILPGMQAAFVDIGLKRDAFLYAGDVRDTLTSMDELSEADPQTGEFPPQVIRPIEELLQPGQELIVQTVKAPLPNKGARISTEITLPGRYVVLLPTVPSIGVSRRIRDPEERERLRSALEGLCADGWGLIVRTAGEGKTAEDFRGDISYLTGLWKAIEERAAQSSAPTLLHQDHDLALRIVRDRLGGEFDQVLIDEEHTYDRVLAFAREVEPELAERIELTEEAGRLFEHFGVDAEIEAALRSRVWLKSGGYIVINQTEALVAVDVNTGRFVGKTSLEETVVATNLEAVEEIVRQIRLRDLSGIIVIDFIDMMETENRDWVFKSLQEELKKDRAKNQVLPPSEFGLVELTRKRSRSNLQSLLTRPCPYCEGKAWVLATSTVCLRIKTEMLRQRDRYQGRGSVITAHPDICDALRTEYKEVVRELEEALGARVQLQANPDLHHERFKFSDS